jgi:PAS domain S-box-containing protein
MVYNEGIIRKIEISSKSHEILQRILIEDVIVGYLRIGVSDEYFWSEMKANILQIAGVSLVGLVILILIIFSSIRKMILRPLTGVVSMLHEVSDLEEIPEDEIGYLESTFSRITASIKEAKLKLENSLADSEKKKNEIALSKDELEKTVLKLQNTMNELVAAYEEMEASNEELEAQSQEIIYINHKMEKDEALLKSIFRVAPTGIGILKNNCFGWTNQMVENLTGFSEKELTDKSIGILFESENDFNFFKEEQMRQISNSGICSMEMLWQVDGNSPRQILFCSTPLDATHPEEGLTFTALDISAQKELEKHLKVSLEEKEILLREIHHRVKNNMQIISSMMNLQSDYVKDPVIRELFKDSQRRVRSMAIVHEKLYQSKNFSEINFSEFINNLVKEINNFFHPAKSRISFSIDVQNLYLSIDKAVPCALIINELVSNSLKYAFEDRKDGTIVIRFHKSGELSYFLTISDNGRGFADGFDIEKSESFGLRLVTILVQQLRGEMEIHKENGVAYDIKFS